MSALDLTQQGPEQRWPGCPRATQHHGEGLLWTNCLLSRRKRESWCWTVYYCKLGNIRKVREMALCHSLHTKRVVNAYQNWFKNQKLMFIWKWLIIIYIDNSFGFSWSLIFQENRLLPLVNNWQNHINGFQWGSLTAKWVVRLLKYIWSYRIEM